MNGEFCDSVILSYIGRLDYEPLPSQAPIEFLRRYLHQLPPDLIKSFSSITTPKQRSVLREIRNRRYGYTRTAPKQLAFSTAISRWPQLWPGRERTGQQEVEEERQWVAKDFLNGATQHVGKLGTLLGDYEEEREAERVRGVRRQQAAEETFVPEEDDSDSDVHDEGADDVQESPEDQKATFERRIKELFIYGLLEGIDYDLVDWSERYDADDDNYAEERWFDEEDEDEDEDEHEHVPGR
ncbi:hypothetical protein F5I97DRAFT_1861555 [Phlebopus sp. FC_14]|nr:hypothetical protein F5I97DRAFT_1861555 [Phlebopus sp. FC_14]